MLVSYLYIFLGEIVKFFAHLLIGLFDFLLLLFKLSYLIFCFCRCINVFLIL